MRSTWWKKRFSLGIVVLLICLLFVPSFVKAEAAMEGTAEHGTEEVSGGKRIRVAMLSYPNFIDLDENGRPYGLSCEYLQEIAKYTGWEYEYIPMSFSEAEMALENGEIDILPGSQYTEERATRYTYGEYPVASNANVLCVNANNNEYYYNDFSSMNGLKIGVLKGSVRYKQIQELFSQKGLEVEFYSYETDAEQRAALTKGEVDTILMASMRCTKDYKIIASANVSDVYFTCNPLDPSIKEGLDAAQGEILATNPSYSYELYEAYYGDIPFAYAFTEKERDYLANAGPLIVAISTDMKPYEYYDKKSGEFDGFVVSYFKKISEITGLKFQFAARGEMEDTIADLKHGDLQLIGSIANDETAGGELPVTLSNAYYSENTVIAGNNKVTNIYNKACTIAIKSDLPQYENLARQQGYQTIRYCDTFGECVKEVNEGKADLTYLPGYSAERIIDHAYLNKISLQSVPVSEFTCSIGVSERCDPLLTSIINKALASIDQTEKNQILLTAMSGNSDPMTLRDVFYQNLIPMLVGVVLIFLIGILLVIRNGTRQRRINLKLEQAKETVEKASAAKSNFLSRMSHDMRTPLNAVMGLTYLGQDCQSLEEAKEYMSQIQASGEYLLGLINDTLDMTKIDSDKIVLKPVPFYQTELIATLNTLFLKKAQDKGIDFQILSQGTNRPAMFDKLRIEQILFNLVNNAIQFTPPKGTVEVEILSELISGDRIQVTFLVRDTGIGMKEEFLKKMYDPFEQEHTNPGLTGTGLGLSIVKQLVDLLDGTITCKSKVGAGTEFRVILEAPMAQPEETLTVQEAGTAGEGNGSVEPSKDTEGTGVKKNGGQEALAGKCILLCEDHPLNVKIAVKLLKNKGMEVTVAENGLRGKEIFAAAKEGTFDAILMDIRMPVMDGLQAAREIRALNHPGAKLIPIIAMTANAFEEDVQKSLDAGMNEHLAKPIDPEKLYEALSRLIQE